MYGGGGTKGQFVTKDGSDGIRTDQMRPRAGSPGFLSTGRRRHRQSECAGMERRAVKHSSLLLHKAQHIIRQGLTGHVRRKTLWTHEQPPKTLWTLEQPPKTLWTHGQPPKTRWTHGQAHVGVDTAHQNTRRGPLGHRR
ncbi:hypothetical protein E2P81_ATG02277 [Venturia nashicola]|nr:hypothetical protein E2P81_ATG02277 [Venturia nashicola]